MFLYGYSDGINLKLTEDSYRLYDRAKLIYHALVQFTQKRKTMVLVDGKQCRVLGRIGMNYISVDVTDTFAKVGSNVIIDVKPMYIQGYVRREYR